MEVELRHLRVICRIAEAGSITRAAASLGTSQPALTTTLQRIERALGGRLFCRTRNGIMPTAFGDCVLLRARTVLAATDELHHAVGGWLADCSARSVGLGGIPGSVVIELAARLGPLVPEATLSVTTDYFPRRLLDSLETGRLDAAVIVDYPNHHAEPPPGVLVRPLATEPVFVALAADHHLAARQELDLAELADEPWVLGPSDGAGWPECFHSACLLAGFSPRIAHRIADLRPLQDIIATGRAISPCQATFTPAPGVIVRPLVGDPVWMRYLIAWHTRGSFGAHATTLVTEAAAAYRADIARSPHYRTWLASRTAATDGRAGDHDRWRVGRSPQPVVHRTSQHVAGHNASC
ncbi:LysR family transcriptional regulator [Amycolatopsis arida]|nr:LysR family transcriptional regulator [Amycolatopsis arida]